MLPPANFAEVSVLALQSSVRTTCQGLAAEAFVMAVCIALLLVALSPKKVLSASRSYQGFRQVHRRGYEAGAGSDQDRKEERREARLPGVTRGLAAGSRTEQVASSHGCTPKPACTRQYARRGVGCSSWQRLDAKACSDARSAFIETRGQCCAAYARVCCQSSAPCEHHAQRQRECQSAADCDPHCSSDFAQSILRARGGLPRCVSTFV